MVRRSAGLFDISHMGRIEALGREAGDALSQLLTSDVRKLQPFQSCYALLCGQDGGIIDDVFVYRLADHFLIVVNAANTETDLDWIREQAGGFAAVFRETTEDTAMMALQGPCALDIMATLLHSDISWQRFFLRETELCGAPVLISRTGYTGEDGVEIICPADAASDIWTALLEAGSKAGIEVGPAGLGARDSLRFEPGFALYGHEISREVTPIEARLLWACDFTHDFIGRDALLHRRAQRPSSELLVSFTMVDTAVPRAGCRVLDNQGTPIGRVVTGLKAPSLDSFAGNAYIQRDFSRPDSEIVIEIRGKAKAARIAKRPLYRPSYRSSTLPEQPEYGSFVYRHIGPDTAEQHSMLAALGYSDLQHLIADTLPQDIRLDAEPHLPSAVSEQEILHDLRTISQRNTVKRALIGQGYYGTIMPAVIRRNILESPAWYTQYTPYQAEISQGRLEALLNFQTMIIDLTGLDVANASLLDEATAAAEAMLMCLRAQPRSSTANRFFISDHCHPQTIEVVIGRAEAQGIHIEVGSCERLLQLIETPQAAELFGGLFQYPGSCGELSIPEKEIAALHRAGAKAVVATDLMAMTVVREPGSFGADIAIGSTQRFGVPMGFGGPHAAFIAATSNMMRQLPGRVVGLSHDRLGNPGIRLAMQTREQHIRRDRATSNICTAQVLPAILASMYAVYHGPGGLRSIAERINRLTWTAAQVLTQRGYSLLQTPLFDTITIQQLSDNNCREIMMRAEHLGFLLRRTGTRQLSFSLDETIQLQDLTLLLQAFPPGGSDIPESTTIAELESLGTNYTGLPESLQRRSGYLLQAAFTSYRSETELQRYIRRLQNKDLSLTHSMIPLGSCTMKLNAAVEMEPISWPGFADMHPFAPAAHTRGYRDLIAALSQYLAAITGLPAVTMQPNSGAQGEFTGLMIIRAYLNACGQQQRTVCLIPDSAHGTNPASAAMAGFTTVTVPSDSNGRSDEQALQKIIDEHGSKIGAIMITYPSTHGVFDDNITRIIEMVHAAGGQIYLDGANLNAMGGITSPALLGADICHMNLHKTFAIPHGGGGPGMGPVCAAAHLAPFLPPQSYFERALTPARTPDKGDPPPAPPVSAAPFGSPSILPISYAYIRLLGKNGLRHVSETAILNANYIAHRLENDYPISYRNSRGRVAHECILDLRSLQKSSGISVEDVAKRLMDYGFHAPTMSWPEPGTLMIEPTESETMAELDRFCQAMLAIRQEIRDIEHGKVDADNNMLKNAPHTMAEITSDDWPHPYSREAAAFPLPWVRDLKFWPATARIDNVYGDRHPVCACPM